MPDRHPHGGFDQGRHGDARSGIIAKLFFQTIGNIDATTGGDRHHDRLRMKISVVFYSVALATAILLAAAFLVATGTRGEDAPVPPRACGAPHCPSHDHS
jgi:hypothetical protein